MKIDRLEIKGFKSFPDKTVLRFKPGISAVVGPNGCGKSNVLDAIRWVMGEQRIKSLRGKKMEDVIFNGADSRKPVGLAEVKLILSDTKGQGPPSLKDYDEIMITRRLFRDGESQYEINNAPCRLSDITDFFLDTGVGKNSYAIIEQGRVDMVVASKPEDRRLLIEEAAGISRYKARREAALRKLEQTKQNLLRISDVISEVKRQSASLRKQAAKADKHRKLTERLRELDINLHCHRLEAIKTELEEARSSLTQVRDSLGEKQASQAELSAALEADRALLVDSEQEHSEATGRQHKMELELGELRSRIESAEAGSQRLENRRLRNMASVEELGLRIKDAEEKLNSMIAQRAAIVEELQGLRKNLAQMEEKTKGAREGQSLEQKRIETIKEDIFALLQSTSQAGNRKESLNKRKKEIESQTGKLESEKTDLKRSIEEQRAKLDSRVLEMDRIKERRNHNQEKITNLESERTRITERITSLSDSLTKREMEVGVKKGRLASLHDLQNAFSGYGDGVKSLLGDEGEWSKGRIIAALEEIFDTSEKYQAALIAALDDWTDHLVVESMEFALEAVEKLERTGAGRAGFVPVNPEKFTRIQDRTNIPGVESMLDVITVKEGFEKVANLILGAAVIVKDLPRALELFQDTREPLRIITLDGARLSPGGIIAGGSRTSPAAKIISRKSEIRALEASIDHDEHELGQARDTLNDEDLKLSDINGQLESCRAESSEIKVEEVRIRKDLESTEGEMAKTEMRLDVLDMEIQRFMEESAAVLQEQMDLDNRVEQNTQKRNNLENMKAEAQERLAQYEAMMGEVSAQTNDERVKVAQYEEREKSLTREIDSLKGANERTSNQLNALEKEIREDAGEYERLQSDVKLGREREKSLMEEHRQACEAVKSLKEGIRVLAARIQSSETRSSEMGRAINQLREQAHELQTHIVRREQNENDIVEKITERYGIDPQGLAAKEPRPSVEEIATLKGRIESMGQVNLAAIDESRHTQERLNFLTEQESDLQGAVDSLYTTINKINRTTRDRFKEAFDRINEKFQEIFPFLFRGGAARLELSNADDLLETGVDILARPPGKRIQNMHLLSGGEKALTAVALIFSIFLIRPSPFCLLDEVDAPLDDANLSMFNEMLRRLSDSTQFILITHNKASMERADSLFGVTMAEAGVSNMVSVEFMDKEAV